jgi:hypothetical protein
MFACKSNKSPTLKHSLFNKKSNFHKSKVYYINFFIYLINMI